MFVNHKTHLLFVEPKFGPSPEPIDDDLTKAVEKILSTVILKTTYRGIEIASIDLEDFKVASEPLLIQLSTGYTGSSCCGQSHGGSDFCHPVYPLITNLLSLHYIRYHREEIPEEQLLWIPQLAKVVDIDTKDYWSPAPNGKKRYFDCHGFPNGKSALSNYYGEAISFIFSATENFTSALENTFYTEISEERYLEIADRIFEEGYAEDGTPLFIYFENGDIINKVKNL